LERTREVSVEDFVAGLRAFERDYITKERVSEYCAERRLRDDSLRPYLLFRGDRYTRNLVYRDPLFEVMVICWEPGQRTPIHTHNGQLGWMLVERGGVFVTNYKYLSCDTPENQNVVGIDCLAGSTRVELEPLDSGVVGEGGPVSTVDKIQTIHRIGCAEGSRERAVSLHVYSIPFESCVAFDLEKGQCFRRTLFWDTQYGKPVEAQETAPKKTIPLLRSS